MEIDFEKLKQIKEEAIKTNQINEKIRLEEERKRIAEEKKRKETEHREKYYPTALKYFNRIENGLMEYASRGCSVYTIDEYMYEEDCYDSESGPSHIHRDEPEYWKYIIELLEENKIPYKRGHRSEDGGMYSSKWTSYYRSLYIEIK